LNSYCFPAARIVTLNQRCVIRILSVLLSMIHTFVKSTLKMKTARTFVRRKWQPLACLVSF